MMVPAVLLALLRLTFSLLLAGSISLVFILLLLTLLLSLRFFIIALARSVIFVPSMISVNRFPRAVVSILLAAALLLLPCSSFADFYSPSFSLQAVPNASSGLDLAAGAVLDGALSGLSVDLAFSSGALLTSFDLIKSVISGTPLGTVPSYTYNQSLSDILNLQTIKIRKDYVVIDGVKYSDVWLPHDAADKFRVNAFDFITHYNILSEANGTYASGVGYCGSTPMFSVNGVLTSQHYSCEPGEQVPSFYEGRIYSVFNPNSNSYDFFYSSGTPFNIYSGRVGADFWIQYWNNDYTGFYQQPGYDSHTFLYNISYVPDPFDFTWVSGSIPSEPLPADFGLTLRVPSSYVSSIPSVVSPDLADYVTLISDLSNALEQARLDDAVESSVFEDFDDPAPPVPSTGTIAEEPYSSLDGSLSGIQDSLDNIDTNIGTVDESLDDIQIYAEQSADSLQSIDTNLSQSVADTSGIKGFIQQYLPGVYSILSSISSSVSDIAGSIASADQTFFANVVDAILAPFTPVFDVFKSGVGIWRYVVAWVGNISSPFMWVWRTLSHANGILVSPILASAAGAVVLAVYKKFGR